MKTEKIVKNEKEIVLVYSEKEIITDVSSALDLMATIQYDKGCSNIVLNKEAVIEDFFILSTKLAGEILQKYVNYNVRFAVYGDFSGYTSKPLQDFIYECNQGKDFCFVSDQEQAVSFLSR